MARRQLLALGAEREAIEVRLRGGHLHRLQQGVYAVGHMALTQKSRWMAAVLFCGPRAVLSHRSAAVLWGLRSGFSGAIEVTAPARSRSRGSIRRHAADLGGDEVTSRDGIAVTTVPRTIFDLAASSGAQAVEHLIGESERLRLYDALSLEDLLARHPRDRRLVVAGYTSVRITWRQLRDQPGSVARDLTELLRAGTKAPAVCDNVQA